MPLRALRLFPFPTSSEATPLSFASTLQLAAGRAWSRRVTALSHLPKRAVGTRPRPHVAFNDSDSTGQPGPSDTKRREHRHILNPPITELKNNIRRVTRTDGKVHTCLHSSTPTKSHCSSVNVNNPQTHENGQSSRDRKPPNAEPDNAVDETPQKKSLSRGAHSFATELPRPTSFEMPPTPQCPTSLYENLLYLVNIRRPILRFPVLLDYHTLYPYLQSTSSYNLLISLSLRHRSHGITRQLLTRLELANIPKDTETYRLIVRWFISRGLWNNAWNFVQELKAEKKIPEDIPYRIWLQFCRSPKPRRRRRFVYDEEGQILKTYFERVDDKLEDVQARQKLLMQNRPARIPTLADTTPFTIFCLAQLLVRTDNRDRALTLTTNYLKTVSRSMDSRNVLWCLNIIHALMVSSPVKDGLPRFYENRRLLVSLVKLHPLLHPNSRSLYLLLAPLQRAKRCGTIAWKVLRTFRSNWGTQVEDRRVLRRVSQLALKEGRMDVVKKIVFSDVSSRRYHQRRLHEEYMTTALERIPPTWRSRLPLREVYAREGREARLWLRLRARARKVIYKKSKSIHPKVKKHGSRNVRHARPAVR